MIQLFTIFVVVDFIINIIYHIYSNWFDYLHYLQVYLFGWTES